MEIFFYILVFSLTPYFLHTPRARNKRGPHASYTRLWRITSACLPRGPFCHAWEDPLKMLLLLWLISTWSSRSIGNLMGQLASKEKAVLEISCNQSRVEVYIETKMRFQFQLARSV